MSGCTPSGEENTNIEPSAPSLEVLSLNVQGQQQYDIGCTGSGCHSENGESEIPLTRCTICRSIPALTAKIETSMPPENPSLCVGSCASDIAEYIAYAFNDDYFNTDKNLNPGIDTQEVQQTSIPITPAQRLNRLEYKNTINHLFGFDDTTDFSETLPEDSAIAGFDNVAEGLTLNSTLMTQYFNNARDIVNYALDRPLHTNISLDIPSGASGGSPSGESSWVLKGKVWDQEYTITSAGQHTIEVVYSYLTIGDAATPTLEISTTGASTKTVTHDERSGQNISFTESVELQPGKYTITVQQTNFQNKAVGNSSNHIVLDAVKITSLARHNAQASKYDSCFPSYAKQCVQNELQHFAQDAFGTQFEESDTNNALALYNQLSIHESAHDAFKNTLRTLISSPKFLYRTIEQSNTSQKNISARTFAHKLAYFLWSAPADNALLTDADNGTLFQPSTVKEHIARMIASPKIKGLEEGFVAQWLSLRALNNMALNTTAFPALTEDVKAALYTQSTYFFNYFLQQAISVDQMLTTQWIPLNNVLADFYNLSSTQVTSEMALTRGTGRQGILDLSGWILPLANGTQTSPVKRGEWVFSHLLCDTVPPPPPTVDANFSAEFSHLPMKEQLQKHRENKDCASCHDKIDPVGLVLEKYDAIGQIRPSILDESFTISSVDLSFTNATSLANAIQNQHILSACLTKKLYRYAQGRAMTQEDNTHIKQIQDMVAQTDRSLRSIITEIVMSDAFKGYPTNTAYYPKRNNNWILCANEGQNCQVEGTKEVRFGNHNRWVHKLVNGSITCNNHSFTDVYPGVTKRCEYLDETP